MPKIIQDISVLRQISTPVESVKEAQKIIKKVTKALEKTSNGVGLGAIQIGIPKRVVVIKHKSGKGYHYLINPSLVEANEEFVFVKEGCLSFPNKFMDTVRYKHYTIDNHVIDGDELRTERQYYFYSNDPDELQWSDGLMCIAVQHEMDHLNGVIFLDRHKEVLEMVGDATVSIPEKIGRNDPCPCGKLKANGSPVKYKKCCLM